MIDALLNKIKVIRPTLVIPEESYQQVANNIPPK